MSESRKPRAAIVGVGLIGGSLGMAWRLRGAVSEVIGITRREETIADAIKVGAIDRGTVSLEEGVCEADVVVIASPVKTILPLYRQMMPYLKPGALVTDVGSTKWEICHSIWSLGAKDHVFIGGHPMAGSEREGVLAADPYLFQNAVYVVTPPGSERPGDRRDAPGGEGKEGSTYDGGERARAHHDGARESAHGDAKRARAHQDGARESAHGDGKRESSRNAGDRAGAYDGAVAQLIALVEATGARPITMRPEIHDEIVATVSHVPHMVAVALVLAAAERDQEVPGLLELAAGGFRDTTRVASGPEDVWTDICFSNAPSIIAGIERIEAVLESVRRVLSQRDHAALKDMLAQARSVRKSIPARAKGLLSPLFDIVVHVVDRPGAIHEVTGLIGAASINIIDIEILRVREGEGGTLRLAFEEREEMERALEILAAAGHKARARFG